MSWLKEAGKISEKLQNKQLELETHRRLVYEAYRQRLIEDSLRALRWSYFLKLDHFLSEILRLKLTDAKGTQGNQFYFIYPNGKETSSRQASHEGLDIMFQRHGWVEGVSFTHLENGVYHMYDTGQRTGFDGHTDKEAVVDFKFRITPYELFANDTLLGNLTDFKNPLDVEKATEPMFREKIQLLKNQT